MVAESGGRSFGEAFGTLVKRKRKVAGLSQTQLAEDAYGTSGKVRRISELENGLVANPQPKTIDPLISVLAITDEELESCLAEAPWQPDPDLERAFREARALLEAAAARFEFARPDASLAEIEDHLREKALEWEALRDRIGEIEALDDRIEKIRDEALSALAGGDLGAVDRLLLEAEEVQQQERTLLEVGRQSELRILRGDAAIVGDDGDHAFAMYRDAARMFDPFDPEMASDLLATLAGKVYETARRSLVSRFDVARRLLDELAAHPHVIINPVERAVADYRRSLIYNREAVAPPGPIDTELVRQAMVFAQSAVQTLPPEEEPDLAISARIQLGNVHLSLAQLEPGGDHPHKALEAFEPALVMAREDMPTLVCNVHNSKGAAHMAQRLVQDDDARRVSLDLALEQFTLAMNAAEASGGIEVWGSARLNRGVCFAELAESFEENAHRRRFLRIRANAEFDATIETYPSNLFPDQFAEANRGLAMSLSASALDNPGLLVDDYIQRALDRLAICSSYFTRRDHPLRWAELHVHAGALFVKRARLATIGDTSPTTDIDQARRCFEGAAGVFDSVGQEAAAASCRSTATDVERMVQEAAEATRSSD